MSDAALTWRVAWVRKVGKDYQSGYGILYSESGMCVVLKCDKSLVSIWRILTLALLCILVSSCSAGIDATEGKGYISGDGTTIRIDPSDRGAPIELSGLGLNDEPLDFSDYRGRPLVVNFWGQWCGPCRAEMPELVKIQAEISGTATLVGVNLRDQQAAARAFLKRYGGEWPSIFSPDGSAMRPFMKSGLLNPKYTPTTIVLDSEGRVAASVQGPIFRPGTFIRTVRDIAQGN